MPNKYIDTSLYPDQSKHVEHDDYFLPPERRGQPRPFTEKTLEERERELADIKINDPALLKKIDECVWEIKDARGKMKRGELRKFGFDPHDALIPAHTFYMIVDILEEELREESRDMTFSELKKDHPNRYKALVGAIWKLERLTEKIHPGEKGLPK